MGWTNSYTKFINIKNKEKQAMKVKEIVDKTKEYERLQRLIDEIEEVWTN